nr:hypothetical protein [Tanacetum cinerariifolium]
MRRVGKGCSGVETPLFKNMLGVREVDAEEEVQVPSQDEVAQKNFTKEIADDVAQPTSPVPPSPQVINKCSALVHKVEGLESDNTAQQLEIIKLKARVKKLERLNKERISVDIDKGIELVDDQEKDAQVKGGQVITEVATTAVSIPIPAAKPAVAAAITPISAAKLKVLKVVPAAPAVSTRKRKGVIIRDPKENLHDDTPAETQSAKDKGKVILVEDPKPMKKKDQIEMDAEYARKLQEEEESQVQAKDVQAKGIQYIKRYHGYKKKPQSKFEARKNMIDYLKNTE